MEITTVSGHKRKAGVRRKCILHPKTDMTPMVDLGFLLISFFVITTEMASPKTTNLAMPKEGPPTTLGESDALTVLLAGNNRVFYYHGEWEKASGANEVFRTNISKDGLRKVILEKQKILDRDSKTSGRKGLMLLIKPGKDADYGSVVDLLDEALINNISKYVVLKPGLAETAWLATQE